MTKDEVIRMAREAGATISRGHRQGVIIYEDGGNLSPLVLHRFAELVAAAERERGLANRMTTAEQQRDELAAQVEVMRSALEGAVEYTALLDDFTQAAMREALALPAAAILRQRDARTAAAALRDYVKTIPGGSIIDPQWIADDMRRVADELEKQNG